MMLIKNYFFSIPKNSILLILFLAINYISIAQDQSFESNTVPSNWNASIGTLTTSSSHYKLEDKSLQWDWSAGDVLTVTDLQDNGLIEDDVQGYYQNMFRMWIYNTGSLSTDSLEISFYDNTGTKQFYYPFNLNFTGWRAASISYKNEMYGNKNSDNIVTMKITAPSTGSGTFHFDYIDYTMERNTYRSPDYQLDFLNLDNNKHWSDEMYFQTLTKTVALTTPTPEELADLASVKATYDAMILSSNPGNSNLNTAISKYTAQDIQYENGIVTGVPIYGKDYSDAENVDRVEEFIYTFARDYKHKGTSSSLTYFLNSVRYLLDQGYAEGSLLETTHHIGYTFRNIPKAIHLMKSELENAGLWSNAQKMVEWYVCNDIIWHPTAHDSNLDDALTRSISLLGACLYRTTDAEKVQYLKGYRNYVETWLTAYSKEGNGMKIDYTGFHHNTYYPQYTFGAYNSLAEGVNFISGGLYGISIEKKNLFKNALLVARVIASDDNFPNSLSGRSPLNSISINKSLKQLGLAIPIDEPLIEVYNYNTGGDSDTNSYGTETPPTGFWQVNYANLGAYRQSDWVVDMKGFNKYFWGTEIYTSDNRFGRYQSYGAVEVLYAGGFENSGFNRSGWDWNKTPGATTIHLPWNDLEAVNDRQDENTNSNFAASLRFETKSTPYIDSKLEGNYGMFGMDFQQKAISATHNDTFTFKKSVFCFDGKVICLGSNINNNDSSNNTATNLFQNTLANTSTPIIINNSATTSFPYNSMLTSANNHWILDAVNTGYYIKNGNSITIDRKNQESPNENGNGSFTYGNFASAYINHGTSPSSAGYEYVILPESNSNDMVAFSTAMSDENTAFYKVLQKDQTGHILSVDNKHGYALFSAGNYTDKGPIKSNDQPCLVMTETAGNNLNITVVNPDLNFGDNNGDSQATTITFVLQGDWSMNDHSGGTVLLTAGTGETTINVTAKDGLPVDIELYSGIYNPFYPSFYYEDFRQNDGTRGYTVQIVSNPDGRDETKIGKVISDIPDAEDSNGEFDETRPENRIPNNTTRDQKGISISGAANSTNYALEVWVPLGTIDLSTANPYISDEDPYKYVTFWTESRYANGGTSSLSVLISTDYTDDVTTATWTDVTTNLDQIAKNNDADNLLYLKSTLNISAYDSSNFTIAFKYISNNTAYSSFNRNGVFYISDVNFHTRTTSLGIEEQEKTEKEIVVYPNPSNSHLNIQNKDSSVTIHKISMYDMSGKLVWRQNNDNIINVKEYAPGVYYSGLETTLDSSITKKILIK